MSFGENLQFYRKRRSITQEQLAEQLGVSRQTVSKWEADSSYPEMEKILQLCDMFGCSMDTLLRGEARDELMEDTSGYDMHMNRFTKEITVGIAVILVGVTLGGAAEGLFRLEDFSGVLVIAGALIGALILVMSGMKHSRFVKKHPHINPFYTEEEIEAFENRFMYMIVGGIGCILAGVLFLVITEQLPGKAGYTAEDIYGWGFLVFVTVGVSLIVYAGIQKSKYNIAEYNKENAGMTSREDRLIGMWSGCIMIFATIIFLVAGLVYDLWEKAWIVYVVGGLLCGVVSVIINGTKRDDDEK